LALFDEIRAELGNPHIYQVSREQFEDMEGEARGEPGYSVGSIYGISSDFYPHLYVAPGMTQKQRRNTYYHEALHLVMPQTPHWWKALAARRLAGGGHRDEGTPICGHTLAEIPPRDALLRRIRRASERYNEKG